MLIASDRISLFDENSYIRHFLLVPRSNSWPNWSSISWPRKRVKQGRALIFLFCLKFCVTRIMATSSFHPSTTSILQKSFTNCGPAVMKCVIVDRACHKTGRRAGSNTGARRFEVFNMSRTVSGRDRAKRCGGEACFTLI